MPRTFESFFRRGPGIALLRPKPTFLGTMVVPRLTLSVVSMWALVPSTRPGFRQELALELHTWLPSVVKLSKGAIVAGTILLVN